jgi:hypothetical protein
MPLEDHMTAKELKLDYFKFYDVENRDAQADVRLRGQFDQSAKRLQVRLVDFFANSVSKNGEPMYDKNAHLAWYRGIQPAEPPRRVVLENQFGRFDIRTGTGYGLLVPTQKLEDGSAFPKDLDHFKVYRLLDVEAAPGKTVKLKDQFVSDEAKVNLPLYFAVPVTKKHGDVTEPIHNEKAHLLIFSITTREIQKPIRIKNQFARTISIQVVRSLMLAAPSIKLEWKQL